jgi:carbamoyl-phosphate synthase small subunit
MRNKLVLENGKEFKGFNFGYESEVKGEIFFSTAMVGYQDLLCDPLYYGKIACMSYPLIGNYGLADDDYDFKRVFINGYVVKENNDLPSNFRATRTLSDCMEENKVVGIEGLDTREIVKIIRDEGIMKAMICDENKPLEECLRELKEYEVNENPIEEVSCKKMWYSRTANPLYTVVVIDLGVKTSVVKKINEYGLNVVVVPYNTKLEDIKKLKPNGVIISNGPSNPNKMNDTVELVKSLKGKYPLLGLGLGADLLALTYDAKVTKMKHGHQGANLSVRNVNTNKIEITSQTHFYSIDVTNATKIKVTHENVIDKDVEAFIDEKGKVIGTNLLLIDTLNEEENVLNRFINLMKK